MDKKVVLLAVMGSTPSVLTETVWALAHQNVPVVPDEIVVLTTRLGKEGLRGKVLSGSPTVWERLKDALKKEKIRIEGKLTLGTASIGVIPDESGDEVEDLRTGDDNLRAADYMLRQVRQYTESPDTVVLASIAGGRKTMSALLFSCMTLLGRDEDKVYHVLIPPEYECGMDPPFFFPGKTTHILRNDKKVRGDKIGIELFEVPFVRMRGWYQEKFKSMPPSYSALISKVQTVAPPAIAYPEIKIDAWNKGVILNGAPVSLSNTCFAMLLLLAAGCAAKDLHDQLLRLHNMHGVSSCDWLSTFQGGSRFKSKACPEDLTKVQSELRKKLEVAGFDKPDILVPRRGNPVMFPLSRIKWINREKFADICGHLFSPSSGH